jgi:hypothetical protein
MPKIEVNFRRIAIWMLLAAISTCFETSARADSSSANLSVLVTDSSGAVVPGAHLMLRNSATSQEQQSESGRSGAATFPFLKPGRYQLTVSKEAFADVVIDNITLNVGDDRHLQLVLKVGAAAQTVIVDGSGLTINTTDASVSTVIDRKFVENIPLNGRSFQDLISMIPGVVTQSPQNTTAVVAGYGDFSVNGQRTETNNYTVDGISGNISAGYANGSAQPATSGSIAASTTLGTTQSLVSVDALQEFRVQSSSYSAEYGRTPGGQFSFATRSGTKDFHGTVFDYLRNNFFDANDWFNDHYGKPITALRQNDFGGTLGGPVAIPRLYRGKDRTFFFVSYEGLRLTQPQAASIQYVPSLSLRQAAPQPLQSILNAFPLPSQGGVDYGNGLAQFIEPDSLPSTINSTSVRIDQVLTQRNAMFFRFSDTPSSSTTRTLSNVFRNQNGTQTYTLGLTSQFNNQLSNEFRLGYARSDSASHRSVDNFGGAVPIDLPNALGLGSYPDGAAAVVLAIGSGSSQLTAGNPTNLGRQWNLTDSVSFNIGKHRIKAGVDYLYIKTPLVPSQNPYAQYIYLSASQVTSNSALIANVSKYLNSTPLLYETSLYAQDEWRVSSRISLSLGLRWELDPPPHDQHGNDPYTLQGSIGNPSTLSLAPRGTPLWKTTWYNFAPRLGVAWTAHQTLGWETVFRTGGGVFFDTDNQAGVYGFSALGFYAVDTTFNASAPVSAAQLDFSAAPTAPYTSTIIYAFPSHLQLPYTLQWNTSVEQSLGKRQALTISYVGSNGRRLIQMRQLSLTPLNPNLGTVEYFQNGVSSNYQALQTQFQRTVSHGVHALAAYTWSHSLDFGSNYSTIQLTRGNSDFDVRNNFTGGLSWDLPTVRTNTRVAGWLLNSWGLDGRFNARGGFPVSLQGLRLTDPVSGQIYYGNPTLIPGRPLYLYGNQYPGGRAINGGPSAINPAFILPTSTADSGNAPRNMVRAFGASQVNMAVRRDIPIHDALTFQFRAESFNLLNHPNFGYVDPTLTDATFGQTMKMLNQSLGTVSSLYQQGGARSLQFALKLMF